MPVFPAHRSCPHPLAASNRLLLTALIALAASAATPSLAAPDDTASPSSAAKATTAVGEAGTKKPAVQNSPMDGSLFYQVLQAELLAKRGEVGVAYQFYLEAARRNQSNQLYQRAVDVALQAQAGEQSLNLALTAAKAWRQALPQSREASEYTAQILLALGRTTELAAPLRTLIQLTPAPQQPQVISTLPRTLMRLSNRQAAAQVIDEATQPWRQPPLELAEAWVVSGQGWLSAKEPAQAVAAVKKALAIQPQHQLAGLLAAELIGSHPDAEQLVKTQLAGPGATPTLRLAYARKLATTQRLTESAAQLDMLTRDQPDQVGSWLMLGAVRLELKQPDMAEKALRRVFSITDQAKQNEPSPAKPASAEPAGESTTTIQTDDSGNEMATAREQALLLMSQAAEQQGNTNQALDWIARADPKQEKFSVQNQRARLLSQQGRLAEARTAIRGLPESEPRDAIVKLQAEAALLREAQKWQDAYQVLAEGTKRFPEESDLLYDQAMLLEKLQKFDEMEKLLKKVIALSPENPNAYNALGYSLADRNTRLDEARTLLKKALELRPEDPFITDSLGWLEFRAGRLDEAMRLLRQAHDARPDPEIAAHLGELLWVKGSKEEARRVLRDGLAKDAGNDALKDTIKRLQVGL